MAQSPYRASFYPIGAGLGVGQSFAMVPVESSRSVELKEIEASGWWAQLTAKPVKGWQVNVGAGMDDPELPDGDLAGNSYEKNSTYYGNILWTVAPAATIGAEAAPPILAADAIAAV